MFLEWLNFLVPGVLLALIAGQAVYVALYLRQRAQPQLWTTLYQPRVAVLLCLRGKDPTLTQCLTAVTQMDYPSYEVVVVMDSEHDPAWETVRKIQSVSRIPIRSLTLTDRLVSCGMKCQALMAGVRAVADEFPVVAMVDADSIVASNWLTEIVRPLQDPQVGAVTGDRWFEPGDDLASISRSVWNAAAIVQMNLYRIAWGGSLAMRIETIHKLGILDIWSRTFCEDTVLIDVFRQHRLTIARPRAVLVYNKEHIAWKNLHFWIARQLLTVRLHNAKWPLVFAHGLLVGLTLLTCIVVLIVNLVGGHWWSALGIAGAVLIAELGNYGLLALVSSENVTQLIKQRQIRRPSSIRRFAWQWLLAIPVTQIGHFLATLRAVRLQHVIWRGIEYRVTSKEVKMIRYRPFVDRNQPQIESESL